MDSRVVRAAISLLLTLIVLGICMMWIMEPTDTYRQKWRTTISKKVVPTYFEPQDSNMLIWTFPVLFVATLGSVYLHLGKKLNENVLQSNAKKHRLALWKRPMLVKGPLGIVSGIELAFLIVFIALLIWSLGAYLCNGLPTITPKVAANDGVKVWQMKLSDVALWIGSVGNICLAFLFYPVARGSSLLPLLGLTSEGSIKYHIWLGHMTMVLFTCHGICYITFWAVTGHISEMIKWSYSDESNVAGEISLLSGLVLWAATFPQIRRKTCSFVMLPGFYLFMIDRFLRFLQSRRSVRLLSARVLLCDTLELDFPKSSVDRLDVSIEGPYGPALNHFPRHEKLVMVSGGSGITPFISIIRELIFRSKTSQCKTLDMILIAAFKSSSDLTMLDLLLPMTGSPSELSNLQLQIEAYVTREKEPTDNSKAVRSIWFKPHQTDIPMAAILGPNSWLWLGAIISSSFKIFLILIGIITRYYIYPIFHNKNELSTFKKAVSNILAICVSIAATASAAVFWNKRRCAREAKQIQNMEGQTPGGSPNLMPYNADRELESLPHQSLAEATKIHYGERPGLKRILFECKGSSLGVLVSGPKKLRLDVATICSFGLADNLHFESISFSW
ncbi:hypothetical protein CRYUN_Cryun23aG0136000 [Craigia yunnanensis]